MHNTTKLTLLSALLLLTQTLAHPPVNSEPTPKDAEVTFTIFLATENEDTLTKQMLDISNPKSQNYGQYLTQEEITTTLRPNHNSEPFYELLDEHKIPRTSCEDRIDNYRCTFTVEQINSLFSTEMHTYHYPKYDHIASERNSLPTMPDIPELDFVLGIADHPERTEIQAIKSEPDYSLPVISANSLMTLYNVSEPPSPPPEVQTTDYRNTQAVIEFLDDGCFMESDLYTFAWNNTLPRPNYSLEGKKCNVSYPQPDTEGSLDIQYQYATGPHNNGTLQIYYDQQKWLLEFTENLFSQDLSTHPPLVSSMSWGWWEQNQENILPLINSEQYVKRTNLGFLKNSLFGRTFVSSSGDSGSAGRTNPTCSDKPYLRAVYPTSSPWVLSVGGNRFVNNSNLKIGGWSSICQEYMCIERSDEVNCDQDNCLWASGGGVSEYSERQDWSVLFATDYFDYNQTDYYLPPQSEYFEYGRVYPDVALQAHNYLVMIDGQYTYVDGTSCSSPAFSGMLSRINDWLVANQHPTLGLVTPLIYQMREECPKCFNKPTTGCTNSTEFTDCPLTSGFCASNNTTGYDAVYGLGTPNFGYMFEYVKQMYA